VTAKRKREGDLGLLDLPRLVAAKREAARRSALMRAPDLTYLFWESTLRCNLRCTHCGSSCEAKSPVRELETAEVKAILDTIGEDFDAKRIFATITGGEPLLRADLYEVVGHMRNLGMRTSLVTNGTLLGAKEARRLVAEGMRTVTVSVDGLQPEHEAVRGKGTWLGALGGLTCARAEGFTVVEAVTCVRPANVGALAELEQQVRAAGANRWRLITIDRMGRLAGDAAPEGMWLEPEAIRQVLGFVEARRKQLARSGEDFDLSFSCGGFLGVRREPEVRDTGQCYAGLCIASILCDGQVSACPSLPRSYAQGSALETRFSTLWREKFRPHRETDWRREGACKECSWFDTCLGGGLHERLAQPDEFCWLDRQDG
jgi:radical SAM protein with 4Fe4S-binding SPASM domain